MVGENSHSPPRGEEAGRSGGKESRVSSRSLNLNDRELDAPPGAGGIADGGGTWIDDEIEAIVRSTFFVAPCLEIHDTNAPYPHNLGFELTGGIAPAGLVMVPRKLWYRHGDLGEPAEGLRGRFLTRRA